MHTLTDEVRQPEGHALRDTLEYTLTDEVRQPEGHALRDTLEYTLTDEVRQPVADVDGIKKLPLRRRSNIPMNYQFTETKPLQESLCG